MAWNEDFATGIDEIDMQHKLLFDHTDMFRDVLSEGVGEKTYWSFLEFLQTFVQVHFGYEEQCMFAHRCPCAGKNKKEHALFSKFIRDQVADYERDGFDRQKANRLLSHVDQWLQNHIVGIDMTFRDCAPRDT